MAEFPALPIWTDALIGDTFHLTPAEFGAYIRLLIVAWRRPGCDLPDDDKFLGRAVGDPKRWPRLRPAVVGFFTETGDGRLVQSRLTKERRFVENKSRRASAAGRAGADTRWGRKEVPLVGTKTGPTKGTKVNTCKPDKPLENNETAITSAMRSQCDQDSTHTHTQNKIDNSLSERGGLGGRDAPPSADAPGAKKGNQKKRGTRLPDDWWPDGTLRAWAREHGRSLDLKTVTETFRDYWVAQSGQKGVKLDWDATYRNWIRREMKDANGRAAKTGTGDREQRLREAEDRIRARYGPDGVTRGDPGA